VNINLLARRNLTAKRPAVFIFNHATKSIRSLRAGWSKPTSPRWARRSWRRSDRRTIGKVLDAAFIDREQPQGAVESLKKVEELARKGLSI